MSIASTPTPTPQSPRALFGVSESAANSLTHALGLVLSLIGAPLLVALAQRVGNDGHVVACTVYGLSLIALYAASTRYHMLEDRPGEYRRLIIDHICIYYLIAGTYTAICLTTLHGPWGWTLLAVIWTLAVIGTIFKLVFGLKYERVSIALYVAMGWLAVISAWPLLQKTPPEAIVLILVGGFFYTFGVFFYARKWVGNVRYSHAIWHLSVVAGSAMHYFAVRDCLLSVAGT